MEIRHKCKSCVCVCGWGTRVSCLPGLRFSFPSSCLAPLPYSLPPCLPAFLPPPVPLTFISPLLLCSPQLYSSLLALPAPLLPCSPSWRCWSPHPCSSSSSSFSRSSRPCLSPYCARASFPSASLGGSPTRFASDDLASASDACGPGTCTTTNARVTGRRGKHVTLRLRLFGWRALCPFETEH